MTVGAVTVLGLPKLRTTANMIAYHVSKLSFQSAADEGIVSLTLHHAEKFLKEKVCDVRSDEYKQLNTQIEDYKLAGTLHTSALEKQKPSPTERSDLIALANRLGVAMPPKSGATFVDLALAEDKGRANTKQMLLGHISPRVSLVLRLPFGAQLGGPHHG